MGRLVIRPQALIDLDDIFDYIAEHSLDRAISFIKRRILVAKSRLLWSASSCQLLKTLQNKDVGFPKRPELAISKQSGLWLNTFLTK